MIDYWVKHSISFFLFWPLSACLSLSLSVFHSIFSGLPNQHLACNHLLVVLVQSWVSEKERQRGRGKQKTGKERESQVHCVWFKCASWTVSKELPKERLLKDSHSLLLKSLSLSFALSLSSLPSPFPNLCHRLVFPLFCCSFSFGTSFSGILVTAIVVSLIRRSLHFLWVLKSEERRSKERRSKERRSEERRSEEWKERKREGVMHEWLKKKRRIPRYSFWLSLTHPIQTHSFFHHFPSDRPRRSVG